MKYDDSASSVISIVMGLIWIYALIYVSSVIKSTQWITKRREFDHIFICISCRSTLRLCLHRSWVSQRNLYKVRAINNKNIFRVIISVQFDKQNNESTHSPSIQWHMHSLFITHLQTLKIQYLIIICWKFICTHAIEIPFRQCNH